MRDFVLLSCRETGTRVLEQALGTRPDAATNEQRVTH